MDSAHGGSPAPSMVSNVTDIFAAQPLSALQRLKSGLCDQAYLIEHIPIGDVNMETRVQRGAWKPQRIHVALVTEGRYNSKIPLQKIVDQDAFVGIFKSAGLGLKTPVLIKTCFILKGVPLKETAVFSEGFFDIVKRVSRKLSGLNKSASRQERGGTYGCLRDAPVISETRSHPQHQDSQAAYTTPQTRATPTINPPSDAFVKGVTWHPYAVGTTDTKLASGKRSARRDSRLPPDNYRFVHEDIQKFSVSGDHMPVLSQSKAPSNFIQSKPRESYHKATPWSTSTVSAEHPFATTPVTQNLRRKPKFVAEPLPGSGMSMSTSNRAKRPIPDLSEEVLVSYRSAQAGVRNAERQIDRLKNDMEEKKQKFLKYYDNKVIKIDVDMRKRHEEEKDNMMKRQRAETSKAKELLVDHKTAHVKEMNDMSVQKESMIREKEKLEDERDKLRCRLSHNELLSALETIDGLLVTLNPEDYTLHTASSLSVSDMMVTSRATGGKAYSPIGANECTCARDATFTKQQHDYRVSLLTSARPSLEQERIRSGLQYFGVCSGCSKHDESCATAGKRSVPSFDAPSLFVDVRSPTPRPLNTNTPPPTPMFSRRNTRLLRSDRKGGPLDNLRRHLHNQNLLGVLDSLIEPGLFDFQHVEKSGHTAIRLSLGIRHRIDGTPCQVWACIVSTERSDLQPPVIFYDRHLTKDGSRAHQISLSASSLLRRATHLQPPFCFLQHDPVDELKGARNMLCAIILYQALALDIETCALNWEEFGESLSQALQYIASRDAYYRWQHGQKISETRDPQASGVMAVENGGQSNTENEDSYASTAENSDTVSTSGGGKQICGIIRPKGTEIVIRPNTSLSKLKKELGEKKFRFLDKLPQLPMEITSHSRGPPYFPFRMLIGSHKWRSGEPFDVYAYLVHDRAEGAAMKFLSHDSTGLEQSFTVDELLQVNLLEPIEYLNNLKKTSYTTASGASARTAKIRSIISYYFFLAENEGLVGDPRVKIGEAFGKRLCAAIAELQGANFGNTNDESITNNDVNNTKNTDTAIDKAILGLDVPMDEADTMATKPARQEEDEIEPSRLVNLTLQPAALRNTARGGSLRSERKESGRRMRLYKRQDCLNGNSLERKLAEDTPAQHSETRPSQNNVDRTFSDTLEMQSSPKDNLRNTRTRGESPRANLIRSRDQESPGASMIRTAAAEEKGSGLRQHCEHSTTARSLPRDQGYLANNRSFVDTGTTEQTFVAGNTFPNPRVAIPQDWSDNESVPMEISSPAPMQNSAGVANTTVCKSKVLPEFDDALMGSHEAGSRLVQVLDNDSRTLEGSTEKEMQTQPAAADIPNNLTQVPVVIDLRSDNEDGSALLRVPRRVARGEAEVEPQAIDLTQLSSSSRGKRRKVADLIYRIDNEDDALEETDGNARRRALSRRRKCEASA
ncbi:hypothetical protein OPT61_g5004 [Boeremia exigua]|uniref:Uncharacterized protein n=1 Tax=Boeremia exigua TaxID=749465 RepID=A0ACC2IC05_9PLEO|nr:hypothetical protein OPT61_g5004 [Boeremia exigua]